MANWMENELKVTGPRKDREAFLAAAAGRNGEGIEIPISFAALLPIPEGEPNPDKWAWDNWGTRTDVWEWIGLELRPRSFVASFSTTWAAPTTLFESISRSYPALKFHLEYRDEDGGYSGRATMENGEMEITELSVEDE